jgi:hypothetical protein
MAPSRCNHELDIATRMLELKEVALSGPRRRHSVRAATREGRHDVDLAELQGIRAVHMQVVQQAACGSMYLVNGRATV